MKAINNSSLKVNGVFAVFCLLSAHHALVHTRTGSSDSKLKELFDSRFMLGLESLWKRMVRFCQSECIPECKTQTSFERISLDLQA